MEFLLVLCNDISVFSDFQCCALVWCPSDCFPTVDNQLILLEAYKIFSLSLEFKTFIGIWLNMCLFFTVLHSPNLFMSVSVNCLSSLEKCLFKWYLFSSWFICLFIVPIDCYMSLLFVGSHGFPTFSEFFYQ